MYISLQYVHDMTYVYFSKITAEFSSILLLFVPFVLHLSYNRVQSSSQFQKQKFPKKRKKETRYLRNVKTIESTGISSSRLPRRAQSRKQQTGQKGYRSEARIVSSLVPRVRERDRSRDESFRRAAFPIKTWPASPPVVRPGH